LKLISRRCNLSGGGLYGRVPRMILRDHVNEEQCKHYNVRSAERPTALHRVECLMGKGLGGLERGLKSVVPMDRPLAMWLDRTGCCGGS